MGFNLIRNGLGADGRTLLLACNTVHNKGQYCRKQKNNTDNRSHIKILLTDNLLIHIRCQNIIISSYDGRRSKIGKTVCKCYKKGADQAVFHIRYRDGQHFSNRGSSHSFCRFIEPVIRCRKSNHQNRCGYGKTVNTLSNNNSHFAIQRN